VATVLAADTVHQSPGIPRRDTDEPPGSLTLDGEPALAVRPGELVAVTTMDPRDTTAMIDALSGRVRNAGVVRVGGRWIGDIPAGERHRRLLVEHHNSDLFSGTLLSNLGAVSDDDAVRSALIASCAVDVVDLHADGLRHPVSERGANLSGGQRQRWTLARALVTDPDVLVLHDPTTAVDAVTEQAIADGLRRRRRDAGRSTVVFTSSPALLAAADRVVVIADRRVRSEGTHQSLMQTDPDYRTLVSR
jgi:putative ABC transport system ATP-binding protein